MTLVPASTGRLKIIWSDRALEATKERLFPLSRHRSQRIRKKLIKRFGGEFRMQPCMWHVLSPACGEEIIIAHPSYRAEFESAIRCANETVGSAAGSEIKPKPEPDYMGLSASWILTDGLSS